MAASCRRGYHRPMPTTRKRAASTPTPARVDHLDADTNPIAAVQWIDPSELRANDYNPNHVFGPERELIKRSLIEDGWCAPIVVRSDREIVDGFHRWGMSRDPEVIAALGPLVPVVFLRSTRSAADQKFTTVRMNRARGQHAILKMGEILRGLQAEGVPDDEIRARMGMDREEFDRLKDITPAPESFGKDSFGRGWVPHLPEGEVKDGRHVAAAKAKAAAPKIGSRTAK